MELSSDNIEDLARALSVSTATQDLRNIDVDRVISEAQDSLLSTSMEAIRCEVPCSFNDILDDICEMNNNIELQQAAVNAPNSELSLETPSYYHMPDISLQPSDYTPECSFTNQNDFLQPFGQWAEYLPMPPAALSTVQDIPQLAPIPTHYSPSESQPNAQVKGPIDSVQTNRNSNVEESQTVEAAPAGSLQFFNNFHINVPSSIALPHYIQQCLTPISSVQIPQAVENNVNFMILPEPSEVTQVNNRPQKQPPMFDWARVIPRKTSDVIVLRPLRTRKVTTSRASFDFASYFDTSSISIPMIRERPRCKANRRKQKLFTIPGSENLIFEDQLRSAVRRADLNNNEEQLYPETEIPEIDEIFKRKRRGLNTRRNNPPPEDPPKMYPPSEHLEEEAEEVLTPTKGSDTYSDVDSDDTPLTVVKSMKCPKCRKLFKTCRSLTIHSKRCSAHPPISEEKKLPKAVPVKTARKSSMQSCSSKENLDKFEGCGKPPELVQAMRPITRSQTKRKADGDDGAAKKRFK